MTAKNNPAMEAEEQALIISRACSMRRASSCSRPGRSLNA